MIETSITSMNWVAQSNPRAIQRRGSGLEEDMVPFNGVSAERISSTCGAVQHVRSSILAAMERDPAESIRDVRITPLLMPLRQPYVWAQGVAQHFVVNLVEIEDGEGRRGIGECTTAPDARALAAILRRVGRHLVGRSPFDANAICQRAFQAEFKAWGANNPRFANQLLAGLEMALWDLMGTQTGRPAYDLFGGAFRESVGYFYFLQGATVDELVSDARLAVSIGAPVLYLKLFRLACEYLISVQVIRPGPVTVLERVAHAREQAQRETYDRLAHAFTEQRCAGLDGLLVVDPEIGTTRLRWLTTGAVEASPAGIKAEVTKLEFLRGLGADTLDLSVLPAERRRFLATVGRRLTAQALQRRDPQRRYPILLTVLAQSAIDVLDEAVSLFDQAVSAREGKAERSMRDALAERGKAGEDRQALLDDLLVVIADPAVADEDVGGLIRGERIGWPRIRAALAQAVPRLPRDHGHLGALDVSSYGYLRQFTPQVLAAVEFAGGTAAAELLAAVGILRALNTSGARRVPADAPTGFVPTRWRGYLDMARASGNTSAYRHFWELCTLLALRDGLRTGDVWVPGSRRYSDPAAYLLTAEAWSTHRASFCGLVEVARPGGRAGRRHRRAAWRARRARTGPGHRRWPGPSRRRRRAGHLPADRRGHTGRRRRAQGRADRHAALRPDRVAADRARRAHRVAGLLHPRRGQAGPHARVEAEPDRGADQPRHQPGSDPHGGGVRHLLRRPGLDIGVVRAGGDAARGEPGDRQPPPADAAGRGVRRRHPVLLRRATLPVRGKSTDRAGR